MWIIKNKKKFKNIYSVSAHLNYRKLKLPNLCVDTQKDFILISKIFNKLYKKTVYSELMRYLKCLKTFYKASISCK